MVFELVARFTIESSTPILIGGYDGYACRTISGIEVCEGIRSQSVKGVWRWFVRSLIAGALYSSETDMSINRVVDLTGKLLGRVDSVSEASRFKLVVSIIDDRGCSGDILKKLYHHQRVSLLRLGKAGFELSPKSCRVERACISLYVGPSDVDEVSRALGISSLLLAFVLGCLGKGSRRGLGCFDIMLRRDDILPYYITSLRLFGSVPPTPESIGRLIGFSWRVAARYAGVRLSFKTKDTLPSVPSIAPNVFRLFYAKLDSIDPLDVAIAFSKAVTRPKRSTILKVKSMNDPIYVKKIAWVLGLPRKQESYGYVLLGNVQRRASPIMLSVHRGYALLSVYYSLDWPNQIRWCSPLGEAYIAITREGRVNIDSASYELRELIDEVLNIVLDAMKNQGYEFKEVNIQWT